LDTINESHEAENIHEVISRAFGTDSQTRGKLFVTCVTKEEILVITDPRPHHNEEFTLWLNVYIPTVCGNCMGDPGSMRGAGGDFQLSDNMIRKSDPYKAAGDWCDGYVEIMRQVVDRKFIMKECRKYGVHLSGARVLSKELEEPKLEALPYFDLKFE